MVDMDDMTRDGKYRLKDGSPVPTVTNIVGQLNKPALVRWANNLGKQGIDSEEYLEQAATIGTIAHRLVEARWANEDVLKIEQSLIDEYGSEDVMYASASVGQYDHWAETNRVEPILTEVALVSETYRYGGTVDCIAYLNGKLSVIDLKTGSGIYPEMLIQMAAYAQAAKEMYDLEIEQCVLLNIPKKRRLKFKVGYADKPMIEVGWNVFERLLELYYLRVGLDLTIETGK